MRKAILILALALAASPLPAQGTVNFQNSPSSPVLIGPQDKGTPVGAGEFKVALLQQLSDGTFIQLGDSVLTGPAPGIFVGGTRTTPDRADGGIDPGQDAIFEVQAWPAEYATLADALGSGGNGAITSPFTNPTGDPTSPAALAGFKGIAIVVAEPRSFSLAAIAFALLLLPRAARRRICRPRRQWSSPSAPMAHVSAKTNRLGQDINVPSENLEGRT